MPITITQQNPGNPSVRVMITELESYLDVLYPPENQHGFSIEKLIKENVAFFVAEVDGVPAGCGGIKIFDSGWAELKRIFVRPEFRGRGLAKAILNQLEAYAAGRGIHILRLETGVHQPEAIGLYERCGYWRRGPFGDYEYEALSLYYEKFLLE